MQIYNTLTRKKEEFVPINPGKVGIYACGPTVYNYFHIGNARPFIMFDTLRRFMEHIGYDVTFVQNFTDIDDKMIRRANEEDTTVEAIAEKYIAEYFKDAESLGVEKADVLKFIFNDGSFMACRRSGTEPKIKFYYSIVCATEAEGYARLDGFRKIINNIADKERETKR